MKNNNFYRASLLNTRQVAAIIIFLLICSSSFSQGEPIAAGINKQSFIYAVKDSAELGLDVYTADSLHTNQKKPCVIFVFGGAFITGRRNDKLYNKYFNTLAQHGFAVVSISYRLGLRGAKKVSIFNVAPLKKAVAMAVDDLYDATGWVINNAAKLGIDTANIIISGSSSGAITALTANFESCNYNKAANKLPVNFKYAGVVAFAGAILSFKGKLKYKTAPAPTLLFHGTADKIVPYNKIKFFNKAFYGSSWIAHIFKNNNYPYYIYREINMGHEIAALPMIDNLAEVINFLNNFVINHKPYQVDMSFKDPDTKPIMLLTPKELFKKLQKQPIK